MMSRSLIFKTAFVGLHLTGALCAQNQKSPNIIYVFPDQLRNHAMQFWNEKGFKEHIHFMPDPVQTPNLNRLAQQSVVLTSAQSNFPVSSPHRGMLLTGMYPHNSGISLNCNSNRPISSLRTDAETLSDVLSRNHYDCAYIGKYHADYPTHNNPQAEGKYVEDRQPAWDAYTPIEKRHGFNYWYSYGTFDEHKSPHYWDTDGNRHEVREWSPKHEADKAIEYLREKRDSNKPFFLMWSLNPPHGPYNSLNDCMEEDYNLYKNLPLSELLVRPNVNPQLQEKQQSAPYYFAMITGVDREFGRVLNELKNLGLDENTIVVFSSDHGETMTSHQLDPKNTPYTEAMNVPFIIRYPRKLKPKVTPLLLSTVDVFPTLLSLAGLAKEIPASVQGSDLSAYLSNKSLKGAPQGVLYLRNADGEKDTEGKTISVFPVARGIKTDRYTLAITIDRTKRIKEILFFDDQTDPYQRNNLSIEVHKIVFENLCRQMGQLLKNAGDLWYQQRILTDLIPYK